MTSEQALDLNFLKANAKKIHFFGLGFIQIKIDDTYRVHFYTKKFNTTTKLEDVHNHRYSFLSQVLKGTLNQQIYEVINDPSGVFTRTMETCDPNNKQVFEKIPCIVRNIQTHHFAAGSLYHTYDKVFHTVDSSDAITFLRRGVDRRDAAEIVYLEKPVCPFSVKVPEKELWKVVEERLNDRL